MSYGKTQRERMSDTEALVREGINSPGARVAPFGGNGCYERGADNVAEHRNSGHFRRETGAGAEGFGPAHEELCK